MRVKYELAKSLSAKVRIAESPIADFRGHSLTIKLSSKVRESLRHSRGLFAVHVSPRMSATFEQKHCVWIANRSIANYDNDAIYDNDANCDNDAKSPELNDCKNLL